MVHFDWAQYKRQAHYAAHDEVRCPSVASQQPQPGHAEVNDHFIRLEVALLSPPHLTFFKASDTLPAPHSLEGEDNVRSCSACPPI